MPLFYHLDSPEADKSSELAYGCFKPGEVPPVFRDYSGKADFLTLVCSQFDDQGMIVHFSRDHLSILAEAVKRRFSGKGDLPGGPEIVMVGSETERIQFEPELFGSPAALAIKHLPENMN